MEPGSKRREPERNGMATMANRTRQFRELASALHNESEVMRSLREALVEQRTALAANDAETMNNSSDTVGRILLMLEEVRSARGTVLTSISGDRSTRLGELESCLGANVPLPLEQAREELRRVGKEVAQEVAINRVVLRRAVETREAFLQALFSSTLDPQPVYRPPDRGEDKKGGGGLLFDRVV